MLQIRITENDGSDPIILERAKNRTHFQAVNSSDEGIQFEIAKSDPKADVVNPDMGAYKRFWEVWQTKTNTRLNRGPITSITDAGTDWKVVGAGRSALLADYYKNIKTFYASIENIVDGLRFENLAVEPRTTTLVHNTENTADNDTAFGTTVDIDEKYHGLSVRTKDFAIDENTGVSINQERSRTYFTAADFWSGMGKADTLIVDLGGEYPVSRISLILAWWSGSRRLSNRGYDFEVAVAPVGNTVTVQGRDIGPWTTIYDTGNGSRRVGPWLFTLGAEAYAPFTENSTGGVGGHVINALTGQDAPTVRYVRFKITATHAWFGTVFDNDPAEDNWNLDCDESSKYVKRKISDRDLQPLNDCHASIVEAGVLQQIAPRDVIKPLALQRIDNNNLNILYSHDVQSTETKTTSAGYRRFEPGSLFRRFRITYSGAGAQWNKFYPNDCSNCFPDGFAFGIMDQNNSLIYGTDSGSNTNHLVVGPAFTKHIQMKGASNAVVTWCDAWQAKTDPLSYGASYSYTEVAGDTATVQFRGQSFKWFATIPSGKTPATVDIDIRYKTTGTWSSWAALENGFQLPANVTAYPVYEITYESGDLVGNRVYQIRITNNSGFCSIDSLEGYWEGAMNFYNDDSLRLSIARPEHAKQLYDKRFSAGTIDKWTGLNHGGIGFEGDRVILTSAKGRNHGTFRVGILDNNDSKYDPADSSVIMIPGGDSDGSVTIDLDTGKKGNEIPQAVVFDSNDYFTSGLPWGKYAVYWSNYGYQDETYSTTMGELDGENFVRRCYDCTPRGDTVVVPKPVFIDGVYVHERVGLAIQFTNEQHLEILKSIAEAIQAEWEYNERGIRLEPRIGVDTDEMLREGENTLVDWEVVNDVSQIATMLISEGADIDGLPLYAVTEDKNTRTDIGRTIMRKQDFRNIGDYFQLVGLSRAELHKRRSAQRRVQVTHLGQIELNKGDSFILWTKKMGAIRVRIIRLQENESTSGRTLDMECETWPRII